jgi:hypothetical protein
MVSIYEIGSVARGSSDTLSDKDLLAVGCPVDVTNAVSCYVADGWNIAQYSRPEFEAMASSQSLFVQHVKQDGRAVRDDHGYLRSVLGRYNANENYIQQLPTAIDPILSLGETEQDYWALLLQADILYVAVRNACILHRATYASPDFDFRRLIEWVGEMSGLTSSEKEQLLLLRSLKHAYRERSTTIDVTDFPKAAKTAKKLATYWAYLSSSFINEQEYSNGYFEVRALEKQLVRAVGPIYMDELDGNHELAELWGTICNSNPYKPRPPRLSSWSKQVSDFLAKQISH